MRFLFMFALLATLSACAHESLDGHYSCSYETTEEAYENCMAVAQGAQEETANKAGK